MRTLYKFIHFEIKGESSKTPVFSCRTNQGDDEIGEVRWYPVWRQYVFFPMSRSVYSAGCLRDIAGFIEQRPKIKTSTPMLNRSTWRCKL